MDVSGKKESNSIVYNVFLNKILKNTFSMEINDWVDLSQITGEHH